jgi:glycosyltransferase involved in cell wall biosynthesis
VARLVPHKGAHILIDAFSQLKLQTNDPQISKLKLVIVGGSAYTDAYIKDLHQKASVCNDIIFTDFQNGENLESLFAYSRVLVHPSLNEGLPITVLEAMNYSKPVLVSNIPEHLELITDPTTIFTQNDVNSLSHTLNKFLSLDTQTQEIIGKENNTTINKHYRWEEIVPQILRIYQR